MTHPPVPVLLPPFVLATDGSASAGVAASLVRSIAESWVSQSGNSAEDILTVVTVQPRVKRRSLRMPRHETAPQSETTIESPPDHPLAIATISHPERKSAGLSLEQLQQWVQERFPTELPRSIQVRQGRPATEILNCARSLNAGLIGVGHRGVGGVRELLLGSVSTAIARYAPCSVLVARSRVDTAVETSLQHLLVVIEHTPADQQALAMTRQLVAVGIQTVTLVYVQPTLNAPYLVAPVVSRTPNWQLNQSLQDAQREQGEQILQQAAAALNLPNIPVQTHLRTGDAGPSICQLAQELGANLMVVGSDLTRRSLLSPLQSVRLPRRKHPAADNRRPVLRNTRLSVTEDYVIHYAPCPVMLCRGMTASP